MLTEEQIIAIKKAAIADDPGKPWGDSIAFARAIESAVRAELVAESPLTEDQCNEFRRLPVSFNDMVRAIYEAGRASKADEYAHIRREARNAALEEAAKMCERRANSLRDGLNRKQIATKLSKDLRRTITENMISIAFMARGVNKNDWRK